MRTADEAVRLGNVELLSVFDRLSDLRPLANLHDALADMRGRRELLDDAMRILTERLIPAYERLGDIRSATVAREVVADMLDARDTVEKTLRGYHRDPPVFETLEDVCAALVALTTKPSPKI